MVPIVASPPAFVVTPSLTSHVTFWLALPFTTAVNGCGCPGKSPTAFGDTVTEMTGTSEASREAVQPELVPPPLPWQVSGVAAPRSGPHVDYRRVVKRDR